MGFARVSMGSLRAVTPACSAALACVSAMLAPTSRETKARDSICRQPGPSMRSARRRQCAGPLCLPEPGAVQCLGEGHWACSGSRAIGSTTVRAVPCRFGSAGAAITAMCTAPQRARGCAGASAPGGRARYQRTRRGAHRHAARQRAYRERVRSKVTHQGSPGVVLRCIVSGTAIKQGKYTDVSCHDDPALGQRCAFCRAPLPRWTRIRAGPWGRW